MSVNFRLLVGLGNPGGQYEKTRHNVGFWFLDKLAASHSLTFQFDRHFQGMVARWDMPDMSLLLLKPMTYMNRSGQSVAALAKYYKVKTGEILVAHDELDLKPGVVRLKQGGGHGGHNGLRDLFAHLDSPDFYRLRFGIGHPGDRSAVVSYVLDAPRCDESGEISEALAKAEAMIREIVSGNLSLVMNRLHAS